MTYVKKFYTYIKESVKVKGQKNKDIDLIFRTASQYLIDKIIEDNVHLDVIFKSMKSNKIGYADIIDVLNNIETKKFKIILNENASVDYSFGAIAHEITHVKQVLRNELTVSEDNLHIVWMGENYISVEEYLNLVKNIDFEKYKSLPWEVEAYSNQEIYPKLFKESDEFKMMKGKSNSLDFIIDML
jgi:hypothetical protein